MARIDTFLRLVVAQRASDLHLHAGSPPHLRVDGALVPLQMRAFSSFEVQALVAELMDAKQHAALERDQQVTFVRDVPGLARFRATVLVQRHGMAEVFGCARMYLGPVPAVAHERVFGVTTFELG